MEYEVISLGLTSILFSGIILWISAHSMLSKKSIQDFLPFFFIGVTLSFYAGFLLFEYFYNWLWSLVEFAILVNLVWIFINLWRNS